jgi:hypothetical protein
MNETEDERRTAEASEIEEEIRRGRTFSEKEALARLAGPGAMKGASPVSRLEQAETAIANWMGTHLPDPAGILRVVLSRNLRGSELLLYNLDKPLVAIAAHLQHILSSSQALEELVRQADIEWGERMDERPIFEKDGAPANPDDPYTAQSVRTTLEAALKKLSCPE